MSHVGLIATILACPLCMLVLDMPNWQLTMHNAAAAVHGHVRRANSAGPR